LSNKVPSRRQGNLAVLMIEDNAPQNSDVKKKVRDTRFSIFSALNNYSNG